MMHDNTTINLNEGFLEILYNKEDKSKYESIISSLEKGMGVLELKSRHTTDADKELINEIYKEFNNKTFGVDYNPNLTKKDIKIEEIVVEERTQHILIKPLQDSIELGLHVYIVGPAGSGKTHAAETVANNLKLNYYFTGAIDSEHKLRGFIDAHGNYHRTQFRDAFEHGGLFLFDEIDASYPSCLLAFNAALANGYMDFPDGKVQKHENFVCIAAANTYGNGADRQYVGRNQLDAASLDRFVEMNWFVDEVLEITISEDKDWTKYVQKVRKVIEKMKKRLVISMRASIHGSKMAKTGNFTREQIERMVLFKGGMLDSEIRQIKDELTKI